MTDDRIADQIVRLGMIFAEHPAYASLEKKFFDLVSLRRAQLAAGIAPEVEGIVVTGPPGAGKSMAVQELLRSFREGEDGGDDGNICEALSCLVPSPATEKSVGITCLRSLGYKLERDRPAHIIWDMVRDNLRDRQTLFVHFDEAQHLCEKQTPREIQSVISTLKSLLQNPGWPVGLILSGTPLLKEMINQDAQLTRRLYPIELKALNALQDIDAIIGTLCFYVGKAGLDVCPDSLSAEFVARLVHAACGEFGLLIKFIILAIEQTLRQGKTEVGPAQFQSAYADKSGCMDGMNPFIAVDFERIDCSKLYGEGDTYGL
ncbi:MAG: ATP-binding protein [Paracoccaceae bacterium]|uniref:ATP-binding protein n=1 Tax=Yoonia sp. TaxID=2212373 RepID=UPI003295FEA2